MKDEVESSSENCVSTSSSSFSFFPAIPPPVRVSLTTFGPHACSYLPGRQSLNRALWAEQMPPEVYHAFLDAGFRRSGKIIYQPACVGCRKCVSVRVPVQQFEMSKSQRRCWRKNSDLQVTVQPAADPDTERFELYRKYIMQWHGGEGGDPTQEPEFDAFASFLYESPVNTLEYQYRDPVGKLVGVGICDISERSFSSVYYYYDPEEHRRGLGTFGAVFEIAAANKLAIPYYYLGYWVDECGAMSYKATFRPHELLHPDGVWRGVTEKSPVAQPEVRS